MRIVFKKVIDAGPGRGRDSATLYYELTSISAPQKGMWFVDGNWSTRVTHVTYDARKQTFICGTPNNTEIEVAILEGTTADTVDRIVKSYLAEGWTDRILV